MITEVKNDHPGGMNMTNSVDVAYRMLQVAEIKGIKLSNLQLQKLVYIAHGYLLGWKGNPLFSEAVNAWKYGPVISTIYHQFKRFRDNKIEGLNLSDLTLELSSDSEEIVSGVLDMYGNDNTMDLVNITHQTDTPWDTVWNSQEGKNKLFTAIPNDLIKDHYRKVISDTENVNGL